MADIDRFVLGLDLDGTCADFYGRMREIAAEWTGVELAKLPMDPVWGLSLDPPMRVPLTGLTIT